MLLDLDIRSKTRTHQTYGLGQAQRTASWSWSNPTGANMRRTSGSLETCPTFGADQVQDLAAELVGTADSAVRGRPSLSESPDTRDVHFSLALELQLMAYRVTLVAGEEEHKALLAQAGGTHVEPFPILRLNGRIGQVVAHSLHICHIVRPHDLSKVKSENIGIHRIGGVDQK